MDDDRATGAWVEVRFKRANRPGRRGVRVQEWRSRRTGRTFEVEEGHAYAPSAQLREGQEGYLRHVGGFPVVVADPADAPPQPLPRPSPPDDPPQRRAPPSARGGGWLAWTLLAALLLAVAWGWLR